jgi:hypothetical protein
MRATDRVRLEAGHARSACPNQPLVAGFLAQRLDRADVENLDPREVPKHVAEAEL